MSRLSFLFIFLSSKVGLVLLDYSKSILVVIGTCALVIRRTVSAAIQAYLAIEGQIKVTFAKRVTAVEHLNEVLDVARVEETFHPVDLAVAEFAAGRAAHFAVTAGLPLREVLQLGALGVQGS